MWTQKFYTANGEYIDLLKTVLIILTFLMAAKYRIFEIWKLFKIKWSKLYRKVNMQFWFIFYYQLRITV